MEQLLKITSVPMKYELSVTHAKYNRISQQSQLTMDRTPGGFRMHSKLAKLLMNTRDARNSVCPTTAESTRRLAEKGLQAADEATVRYAREGQQMVKALPEDNVLHQLFTERASSYYPTGQFALSFIPTTGPEIQYQEPDFQMQYQADKLQFDVRVAKGDLEYVPGDVSIDITQWPDVMIEYMGSPIYVPPSVGEKFEASA